MSSPAIRTRPSMLRAEAVDNGGVALTDRIPLELTGNVVAGDLAQRSERPSIGESRCQHGDPGGGILRWQPPSAYPIGDCVSQALQIGHEHRLSGSSRFQRDD